VQQILTSIMVSADENRCCREGREEDYREEDKITAFRWKKGEEEAVDGHDQATKRSTNRMRGHVTSGQAEKKRSYTQRESCENARHQSSKNIFGELGIDSRAEGRMKNPWWERERASTTSTEEKMEKLPVLKKAKTSSFLSYWNREESLKKNSEPI